MNQKNYNVIVIGAGAAGLMGAIRLARAGISVLLLDSREKIGAKILMSGGTRCNVTNNVINENDYESESIKVARNILRGFTSSETIRFFEQLGVKFVLEPGGKYFPTTHSGKTILDALLKALAQGKISLKTPCKVKKVIYKNGYFFVEGDSFSFQGETVILTTGGLSFPQTGSDGGGYTIAQTFGHKLIATAPSLTPLTTENVLLKSLSGVTLEARLSFWMDGKVFRTYEGSFLFTHVGFSGPVVLNISRHWLRLKDTHQVKISCDFMPQIQKDELNTLLTDARQFKKKNVKNLLSQYIPENFAAVLLKLVAVDQQVFLNDLKKEDRLKIVESLKNFTLPVSGAVGYSKAEVTSGGVDLKEVDSKTLESKYQKGLFFAGEILDVDGRIGGFNFQWAWSSAVAASGGVQEFLKKG